MNSNGLLSYILTICDNSHSLTIRHDRAINMQILNYQFFIVSYYVLYLFCHFTDNSLSLVEKTILVCFIYCSICIHSPEYMLFLSFFQFANVECVYVYFSNTCIILSTIGRKVNALPMFHSINQIVCIIHFTLLCFN